MHLGVLVMAIGVAVSSGLSIDRIVTLAPGETAEIGGYAITHERLVVEPLATDSRVIETRAEVVTVLAREGVEDEVARRRRAPVPVDGVEVA